MVYIGFSDCGYECFNSGHYLLFSENNAHELLFNYVAQDLSCLPDLFEQYVSQRMDTSNFSILDCHNDNTAIEKIKGVLITAHPYYKYNIREILIEEIGNYFNDLLLYLRYKLRQTISDYSEAWYMERITNLLYPLLELGDTYPKDFYNEFQKQNNENIFTAGQPATEIETFIFNVPSEKPVGLDNEIRTQQAIYNMLYFLLDISAKGLEELTTPQRIWLYSNIMNFSQSSTDVSKRLSFKHPGLCQDNQSNMLDDMFRPLYDLGRLNVGRDGVPVDMSESFQSVIDYAKTVTTTTPYDKYKIDSLYQLLYLEILSMIQNKIMIRKCRRCGKYFVVPNRKVVYCSRTDESGMCCSKVGSQQAFEKKMKEDEALRIYNRAYKTHHARVRKKNMEQNDFLRWCNEAKQKLGQARTGELDIASFQKWLKI